MLKLREYNTISYVLNLFLSLNSQTSLQNEKPALTVIDIDVDIDSKKNVLSFNLRILQDYFQPKIARK